MVATITKPSQKPRLRVNVSGGGHANLVALVRAAKEHPEEFYDVVQRAAEANEIGWEHVRSLPALLEALIDIEVPVRMSITGLQERTIMSSAFPLLSGALTIAALNAGYERVPTIGQDLVREMDDPKEWSVIAGVEAIDVNAPAVKEGDDFPMVGATEEKFHIGSNRNGRRLAITQETVDRNDVAGIIQRINGLMEIGADYVEERTLAKVTDHYGSGASPKAPYALIIGGTATQLYNATADNPGTKAPSGTRVTNNALVDETDLNNALNVLAAMKNSRGKRLSMRPSSMQLLVPFALLPTADKILGSELTPGTENELNNWGPRGRNRPQLVSSPKMDDLSTSAWYLGDFKRQFMRKWGFRMEYMTLAMDAQTYLRSRIAFQARIAWDCEIGATDYVYVVQCLAATTAPIDE